MELDTDTAVIERTLDTTLPTTHAAPVQVRGLDLLDLVIHQIELTPDTWRQHTWRCETGMCVAGWVATLAGGEWATKDPGETLGAFLVEDPAVDDGGALHREIRDDGVPVVSASCRAKTLLGITWEASNDLFEGDNTLDRIKAIRDELRSGSY